ncbi:MAG: short-chain dehydrogenase [Mucilaginibacter sp.]|nr:short-chain dehydrogenase [Mucilaginibacter sp.]
MNITNKTVLITGGGSGIGFEIAKLLSEKGNKVIITGRSEARLQKAAAQLNNVSVIAADITNETAVEKLVTQIKQEYGKLDILINNAGNAYAYNLAKEGNTFQKAKEEFETNLFSILRLTDKLLPVLSAQTEGAIVNVSSVVAFVPAGDISTYSASKAALHSYTQSLRHALQKTAIKVFELMPPLVNTEFSKDIGGENGIHPNVVAEGLIDALEKDEYEIHIGNTAYVYQLSLSSPAEAFNLMNQRGEA